MDFRVELFSARQKRAAAVVVAALVVIGVAALSALRPPPASHTAAVPTPSPPRPALLAIAPESASSLYAVVGGTSGLRVDDPTRRLVRSTDAGRTWKTLSLPRDAGVPTLVELVPGSSDVLVSAFTPGADFRATTMWRSSDHGGHWTQLAGAEAVRGLPQFVDRLHGYWFTSLPDFALRATADGGRSWRTVLSIPAGAATLAGAALPAERSFTLSATAGAVFVVVTPRFGNRPAGTPQVFRSGDGGSTWTVVSLDLPDPGPGAFFSLVPPQLGPDGRGLLDVEKLVPGTTSSGAFLSGSPMAFLTSDGGVTWQGPRQLGFFGVTLGPDGEWWAVQQQSLYLSRDQGATWVNLDPRVPPGASMGTLRFLSARVIWSALPASPFALRSMDGGRTWTEVPGPGR